MPFFLILILSVLPVFADLEKVHIKNLDFDYVSPYGSGQFEKLSIGLSLSENKATYPIEVHRRENSMDVVSPFVDFEWLNPEAFVHNLQKGMTKQFNLVLDKGESSLKGEWLKFTSQKSGELAFKKFDLKCKGPAQDADVVARLKTDCLDKMEVTVEHMELPFEFLTTIADQLPDIPTETEDFPANDFGLHVYKGDFNAYVRIKYVVRAYLRMWGHVQWEDEGKTLAIRVDLIKYGVLPVTNLVMNELRRQIKHPNVTITPPWIKIKQ